MIGFKKWFWSGTFLVLATCMTGLLGCAAGAGGGGEGEAEAGLAVDFDSAGGGNAAVGEDEDGNEYTFRENDEGDLVEANVRMANTGVTLKASLDAEGRPVKYRVTDGTNADVIYDGEAARVRYTEPGEEEAGRALDVSGIDSTAAKQKVLLRRVEAADKRAVAMQVDEEEPVQQLRAGLATYEVRTESLFDAELNPESPLIGSPLEEPARHIARIASTTQIRRAAAGELADVDLDEVPGQVAALAGRTFELFDAEGFCVFERGHEGQQGSLIRSVLTFNPNGILVTEIDRRFMFDLGLGGEEAERTINWSANTSIPLTLAGEFDFTAMVTPVFTGTQVDDQEMVIVERRFLAEFEFPVEAFTTTTARTEQLFNAAFINGELIDDILEFDLVLIDLADENAPLRLGRLRYYDQNTARPGADALMFPCTFNTGEREEVGNRLRCPASVQVFEPFEVAWAPRGGRGMGPGPNGGPECGGMDAPCLAEEDCCPGLSCSEEGFCASMGGNGNGNGEGPMNGAMRPRQDFDEFSTNGDDEFPDVGTNGDDDFPDLGTNGDDEFPDLGTNGDDEFPDIGTDGDGDVVIAPGPDDDVIAPGPDDDTIGPVEGGEPQFDWFVSAGFGWVVNPFEPVTEVVPTAPGPLEVTLIISYADVEEVFEIYTCEVFVGDLEPTGLVLECPEVVLLGEPAFYSAVIDDIGPDDWIEWFVPGTSEVFVVDPFATQTDIVFFEPGRFEVAFVVYRADGTEEFGICSVNVEAGDVDFCDDLGWYGDGVCDDFCPRPDPDCRGIDWCAEFGYYDDGVCDPDCPRPDPDCKDFDWCEGLGWYGDGECDFECPRPDPDCNFDWCEAEGFYNDGWCDPDCPRPDPDCEGFDWCAELGFYDDGECDYDCPRPDPDCQEFDWCEAEGFYGDGWCDPDCPRPDPDCEGFDWCDDLGWYGDGECDFDCPRPDPDCGGADWCEAEGFYGDGFCDPDCPRPDPDCLGIDWCAKFGYYDDGVCDPDCPRPDPDCFEEDWCEESGYYGDGFCDPGCPRPDPDCVDDWCGQLGWYGDGVCDPECPMPDPDCEELDWCEAEGLYGDGFCDYECPMPDPDCGDEFDFCAEQGWYGDGVCDPDCPRPDPDCEE